MAAALKLTVQRLIDSLAQSENLREQKASLVRQLASQDNHAALWALHKLRVRGWLVNGTLHSAVLCGANLSHASLQGLDLSHANLFRANLTGANLRGTLLVGANLEGAFLLEADLSGADLRDAILQRTRLASACLRGATVTPEQLTQAMMLYGAVMPDGSRYDGRYCLQGDFELARFLEFDISNPAAMSRFYGVTLEEYMCGLKMTRELQLSHVVYKHLQP